MALDHIEAQFEENLTKEAYGLLQDRMDFAVANGAIPQIFTPVRNGNFKVWSATDFRRRNSEKRAGGTEFKQVNTHLEDKSYSCQQYGYEENVDDDEQIDGHMNALAEVMMEDGLATFDLALKAKLVAGQFGTDFTGQASGADYASSQFNKWSTAGATPITDIKEMKTRVKAKIGVNPDSLLIGEDVFNALTENAQILARLRTDADKEVTTATLAKFFGLKNVFVIGSAQTTSNQGQATQTTANIISDVALLYYRGTGANAVTPSTIKIYCYNKYGSNSAGVFIETYRKPAITSDCIRVRSYFDITIQMAEGGLLLTDVI